jgi:hypothetical protein
MPLKPDISNELRSLVREVLRETLPEKPTAGLAAIETVSLASDHDLAAFVARVTEPQTAEKIRAGKLRFTLTGVAATAAPTPPATPLTGVVTERKIGKLPLGGILLLDADAVLTPLARDRARKLGFKIERRR